MNGTKSQEMRGHKCCFKMHGVCKSKKKSHSTLRAKRVPFTYYVDNS